MGTESFATLETQQIRMADRMQNCVCRPNVARYRQLSVNPNTATDAAYTSGEQEMTRLRFIGAAERTVVRNGFDDPSAKEIRGRRETRWAIG